MNDKDWKSNKASITTHGFHNLSKHERENRDFYATDPNALEKLLQRCEKDGIYFNSVWECACGMGHLSDVLIKYGIHGKSTDIVNRGYVWQLGELDFLEYTGKWEGDIITNPPYKYATKFVYKALEIIEKGNKVAMIFPQRYLSSKERYKLFTTYPPRYVYAFSRRIGCAMNGRFDLYSNMAVDYMWIIWEKGFYGDTILRWIL